MKSLLVFIPKEFHLEKPGFIYGLTSKDVNDENQTKFIILGCTDLSDNIKKTGKYVCLGYYYGSKKKL